MPMVLQEGIISGQYGPCLVKRRDRFSKWSEFTDRLAFRGPIIRSLTPLRYNILIGDYIGNPHYFTFSYLFTM